MTAEATWEGTWPAVSLDRRGGAVGALWPCQNLTALLEF